MTGWEFLTADKWLRAEYRRALRTPSMFRYDRNEGTGAEAGECHECLISEVPLMAGLCPTCYALSIDKVEVVTGSGNVFADLGLPDADALHAEAMRRAFPAK